MKTLHFKSPEAYRKWNAYRYVHGIRHPKGHHYPKVAISGHAHKVWHVRN